MTSERKRLPQSTGGDHLHTLARAGLTAIPVVGGAAMELFTTVIAPPLTKRRDEWLQSLADDLAALETTVAGFKVENLVNNEAFVTMVMEASNLAVRSHTKEKIDALRSAVLNSAIMAPDEYLQAVLLQFLSIATPWHLRVLEFYRDPEAHVKRAGLKLETGALLSHIVDHILPDLKGNEPFRLQIERDLLHHGLIVPEGSWYSKRTTNSGDAVLEMVTTPLKKA